MQEKVSPAVEETQGSEKVAVLESAINDLRKQVSDLTRERDLLHKDVLILQETIIRLAAKLTGVQR